MRLVGAILDSLPSIYDFIQKRNVTKTSKRTAEIQLKKLGVALHFIHLAWGAVGFPTPDRLNYHRRPPREIGSGASSRHEDTKRGTFPVEASPDSFHQRLFGYDPVVRALYSVVLGLFHGWL
jgi:hypothetical protein